jgi:hypothetical protein
MNNKLTLILIILLISAIKPTKAQDNALKNGFSLNLIAGYPSPKTYGLTGHDPDNKHGNLIGFEVGNRWYLKTNEKYGFGLMLNWLDITYHDSKLDVPDDTVFAHVLNISLCEFGPIGTYAITPNTGLDAYYNIRPTWLNAGKVPYDDQDMDGDGVIEKGYYASNANGFGLTHTMGISVRWKSLALSCEYLLGNLREIDDGDGFLSYGSNHISANHFRFMIGVKF